LPVLPSEAGIQVVAAIWLSPAGSGMARSRLRRNWGVAAVRARRIAPHVPRSYEATRSAVDLLRVRLDKSGVAPNCR